MRFQIDDLRGAEIQALLSEHLEEMHATSPAEAVHALDLDALRAPNITFWTLWKGDDLLGCGALKEIDETHGEVKSMRTAQSHRGTGAGRAVLSKILETGRKRGYKRISLETGTSPNFLAARRLYEAYGFEVCEPFGDYEDHAFSLFMTLRLA